jgi:hypothetical protein
LASVPGREFKPITRSEKLFNATSNSTGNSSNDDGEKTMKRILRSILESDFKLLGAFFLYPAAAALFVQLILLPLLFPQWHAGEGLLAGGDWYGFHQIAVSLAEKIHAQGWSAWELRPQGQAPCGVAAIFYVLFLPHPWVLIPLYAGLHATAAFVLFKIILRMTGNRALAFIAVLPFWLYPSAMLWYSQIHKDGYFIIGALLFLYGWMLLASNQTWERNWWPKARAMVWVFLGAGLVWVVRPYGVQMMQGVAAAIAVVLTIVFLSRLARRHWQWERALLAITMTWVILAAITPLTKGGIYAEVPTTTAEAPTTSAEAPTTSIEVPTTLSVPNQPATTSQWQRSGWPDFIENIAYTLALVREESRLSYPEAASNVDVQVSFHSIRQMLAYVPRAAQIAFLSPFPNQWFGQGSLPANTVMRRVSAVEMLGVYLGLALLPLGLWRWRSKAETWLLFVFCAAMILIYALVIANVGWLYRVRYGFIMTLVAVGIAAGLSLRQDHHRRDGT